MQLGFVGDLIGFSLTEYLTEELLLKPVLGSLGISSCVGVVSSIASTDVDVVGVASSAAAADGDANDDDENDDEVTEKNAVTRSLAMAEDEEEQRIADLERAMEESSRRRRTYCRHQ